MAHHVVKILEDGYGEKINKSEQVWHFVSEECGDFLTFCAGEFFGESVSAVVYKTKHVQRGGITCEKCLFKINEIKKIKL